MKRTAFIWFLLCGNLGAAENGIDYWRVRYTPENHPQYYQSIVSGRFGYWYRHGDAHGPGQRGSRQWLSSNPNTLDPWARPAGTNGVDGSKLGIERTLLVPTGSWIDVWKVQADERGDREGHRLIVNGQPRGRFKRPKWHWRFPQGTKVSEKLYYDGKLFADRAREKVDKTSWQPIKADILFEPPGYREVNRDCVECHKDAGKNVTLLDGDFPGREWYSDLRGDDQVFSLRPITLTGKIQPGWEKFVRRVDNETATVP